MPATHEFSSVPRGRKLCRLHDARWRVRDGIVARIHHLSGHRHLGKLLLEQVDVGTLHVLLHPIQRTDRLPEPRAAREPVVRRLVDRGSVEGYVAQNAVKVFCTCFGVPHAPVLDPSNGSQGDAPLGLGTVPGPVLILPWDRAHVIRGMVLVACPTSLEIGVVSGESELHDSELTTQR